MDKEINIKSTTIDKTIDLLKDFAGKLIGPGIEQVGLILSDQIQYFRFKNQVKILSKTKNFVEKRKINIKEIPVKILVPLLEQASLEENEDLQELWAKMLTNMVDSNKNLENNIFPYLLGQISLEEFKALEALYFDELEFSGKTKEYRDLVDGQDGQTRIYEIRNRAQQIEQNGFILNIMGFELSNLERLGVIRRLPPKVLVQRPSSGLGLINSAINDNAAKYDMNNFGYRISDLGVLFIESCQFTDDKTSA